MPPRPKPRNSQIETALAAIEEFESGFTRSKRGNLWRNWEGNVLTIFNRKGGDGFGWCIADDDETQFSSSGYETEQEALSALGFELGVGGQ